MRLPYVGLFILRIAAASTICAHIAAASTICAQMPIFTVLLFFSLCATALSGQHGLTRIFFGRRAKAINANVFFVHCFARHNMEGASALFHVYANDMLGSLDPPSPFVQM